MDAYRSWVRQNRQWISSFETLANTLTWFLPERFSQSELTPEAVSTLLGLVTVMNQHIIDTSPPSRSSAVPHDLAVRGRKRDDSFHWCLCMSIMKEVEVLTEMAAEYYIGKDKKWGPVASVEAIKLVIRLIILKKSGYKMLLDGGETKNVGEAAPGPLNRDLSGRQQDMGMPRQTSGLGEAGFPTLPRRQGLYPRDLEGRAMQAMHRFSNNRALPNRPSWLVQQPRPEEDSRAEDLSSNSRTVSLEGRKERHINRFFVGGEVLLISRPLLYVLLVWRYGLKSWRPWVAALSIDLAGMYLVSSSTSLSQRSMGLTGVTDTQQGACIPLSKNEVLELRRRQLRWAFYVLRNPFFDRFTRPHVEAAEKLLSPVPVVGMLAGKAVELLLGVQGFYSYTAAS